MYIPESAARSILVKSKPLYVKVVLTVRKGVVEANLQRPLANKVGEFVKVGDPLGLSAYSAGCVLGVGTGDGEEVDVGVDDDVGRGVKVFVPRAGCHETILHHHGDAFVELGDVIKASVEVLACPVGCRGRKSVGATEFGEIIAGLVDRGDCPCGEIS